MTNFRPLVRLAAIAGVIVATGVAIGPAFAGPAETALLKSYEGSWRGKGQVVGADTETVTCRMSLSEGNDDKVNYSGRCALAGANLSINGTLAYIDANRRYEGAMTSNVNFSGVAIGQKVGDSIVFNLKERGTLQDTNTMIAAGITLSPGGITVKFDATDSVSGKSVSSLIPFQKL